MLRKLGRRRESSKVSENKIVPPGQFTTEKFPVLTFGSIPVIDLNTWQLNVSGLVGNEISLNWRTILKLPNTTVTAEFHCVTQWSNLHNVWEGVAFKDIMGMIRPYKNARHVMIHSHGGYSTNLPLDVLLDDHILLAHTHEGRPLKVEHGAPLRLVVPSRYGWKSAKWIREIEFMADDRPGFWESRGYHMNGDPWKEERFQVMKNPPL